MIDVLLLNDVKQMNEKSEKCPRGQPGGSYSVHD